MVVVPREASAQTEYLFNDKSNAQTQIDINHTSQWTIVVGGTDILFGGANLTMKAGPQATAGVTFTLYGIDGSTVLDTATLSPQWFSQSYAVVEFILIPNVTLVAGKTYYAKLTSLALDKQSVAYFIKGVENMFVGTSADDPNTTIQVTFNGGIIINGGATSDPHLVGANGT